MNLTSYLTAAMLVVAMAWVSAGCGKSAGTVSVDQGVTDIGPGRDAPRTRDSRGPTDAVERIAPSDGIVDRATVDGGTPDGRAGDSPGIDDLPGDSGLPDIPGPADTADAADTLPDLPGAPDAVGDGHLQGGVYGKVLVLEGNCMPPAPPDCEQEVPGVGKIFFVEVTSESSFATASDDDGEYEIALPDGEYYVWPAIGWDAGYISEECWLALDQCSEDEYSFIQGDFDYMEGAAKCTSDALWQSHARCNVVISGNLFKLDMIIDNVAY